MQNGEPETAATDAPLRQLSKTETAEDVGTYSPVPRTHEIVFVAGKSGKIEFLFSELYAAKRVR